MFFRKSKIYIFSILCLCFFSCVTIDENNFSNDEKDKVFFINDSSEAFDYLWNEYKKIEEIEKNLDEGWSVTTFFENDFSDKEYSFNEKGWIFSLGISKQETGDFQFMEYCFVTEKGRIYTKKNNVLKKIK